MLEVLTADRSKTAITLLIEMIYLLHIFTFQYLHLCLLKEADVAVVLHMFICSVHVNKLNASADIYTNNEKLQYFDTWCEQVVKEGKKGKPNA